VVQAGRGIARGVYRVVWQVQGGRCPADRGDSPSESRQPSREPLRFIASAGQQPATAAVTSVGVTGSAKGRPVGVTARVGLAGGTDPSGTCSGRDDGVSRG
jgi:hypothetical protein